MKDEHGIIWNDPDININWEIDNPLLSPKDIKLPKLSEQNNLPELK
jgi:dTDP-4-dehydrorhamnose 3,5-epimerase